MSYIKILPSVSFLIRKFSNLSIIYISSISIKSILPRSGSCSSSDCNSSSSWKSVTSILSDAVNSKSGGLFKAGCHKIGSLSTLIASCSPVAVVSIDLQLQT